MQLTLAIFKKYGIIIYSSFNYLYNKSIISGVDDQKIVYRLYPKLCLYSYSWIQKFGVLAS